MTTGITVRQWQAREVFEQRFLFLFDTQTLMNHLWLGENLKDSIAAPVLLVDSGTAVTFEPTFDKVKPFKDQSDSHGGGRALLNWFCFSFRI